MTDGTRETIGVQVAAAIGALLMVVPALLVGVAYVDTQAWPPLTDPKYALVLLGLVLLTLARLAQHRGRSDR